MASEVSRLSALSGAIALFATLGGCTTVPDLALNKPAGPTVKEIEDQIRCEVSRAVFDHKPSFTGKTWAAVATLTLQVDDFAQVSPSLSYIDPLKAAGLSFTFGMGLTASDARQRIFNETVTIQLDDLPTQAARPDCMDHSDMSGDLKIEETVTTALDAVPSNFVLGPVKDGPKNSNAFGELVQFVVIKNVNGLGPTWTLKNFKGPGGLFGASQTQTQKLVISFGSSASVKSAMMNLLLNRTYPSGLAPFSSSARLPSSLLEDFRNIPDKPLSAWSEQEKAAVARNPAFQSGEISALEESQVNAAAEVASAENLKMILQSLGPLQ